MKITLSDFINIIKSDLLLPPSKGEQVAYPFMAIEGVELEVNVQVSANAEGEINIEVIGEGEDAASQNIHRIKIKLAPLVDITELREQIKADHRLYSRIQETAIRVLQSEASKLPGDPTTDAPPPPKK